MDSILTPIDGILISLLTTKYEENRKNLDWLAYWDSEGWQEITLAGLEKFKVILIGISTIWDTPIPWLKKLAKLPYCSLCANSLTLLVKL